MAYVLITKKCFSNFFLNWFSKIVNSNTLDQRYGAQNESILYNPCKF